MIPYSRLKRSDLYTLSYSDLLENYTLHSGTYLYSPYMAVPPPPRGAEQYIKIPVITWRNYREETRHESNPHLAPRLPWTAMNMLSKSWEIPHPHGLTMPSNTITIPHIAPHRPGVGGGSGFQLISALRLHVPEAFNVKPYATYTMN